MGFTDLASFRRDLHTTKVWNKGNGVA